MTFQTAELNTQTHWWQHTVATLAPIYDNLKRSSVGLNQGEIGTALDKIHDAYVTAHVVKMPIEIKAQLIAALCNLQMSYCARYEGQKRESAQHFRVAQVEWILFQEMLQSEGIDCRVIH